MKASLLIFSLIVCSFMGYSQENDTSEVHTPRKFVKIDKLPEFPGGKEAMYKIIGDSMNYPKSAQEDGISGTVYTSFVVDTNGNISDIEVIKGVRNDLDNEAIRVISLLNGWSPGIQENKKVKVKFTLPLFFNLKSSRRIRKEKKRKINQE